MQLFFVIIYSALVGSFLNAVIDRLHTGESIKTNRSHCDSCGHVLGVLDLIPIVSWLLLRGRCRYCSAVIPVKNLLIEFATVMLVVATYFILAGGKLGGLEELGIFVALIIVVCSLLVLCVYDLEHQILPDRIMIVALAAVVLLHVVTSFYTGSLFGGITVYNAIVSSVGSALPYLVIIILPKGAGMGGGDLKLAFVMGLLLGYPRVFIAHYLAFLLGGVIALVLLVTRRKRFGQAIAFGPFLILGTYIALFFGDEIVAHFAYWIP